MMTNNELARWRRQAQRRIREVLALRRGSTTPTGVLAPTPPGDDQAR